METYKGGRGKKPTFSDFRLDTLDETRETFASIIKAYGSGEISESMGRALTYMLSNYLNYWKLIEDVEIAKKLEEIEARLPGGGYAA